MSNRVMLLILCFTLGALAYKHYTADREFAAQVRDAPKGASISLDGLPIKGSAGAKVVVVDFSDYQCPYCIKHFLGVGKQLESEFILPGRVREAFVNNPLPTHGMARFLAATAICAGKQGQYWRMHDELFGRRPNNEQDVGQIADALLLDKRELMSCAADDVGVASQIDHDVQQSKKLELTNTPAFALGRVRPDGSVSIEKFIQGALPLTIFESAINQLLREPGIL
jgi:protein-disulfide isomerase